MKVGHGKGGVRDEAIRIQRNSVMVGSLFKNSQLAAFVALDGCRKCDGSDEWTVARLYHHSPPA